MANSDRLVLEGMEFYGFHGDLEAERVLGARFRVDLELQTDLSVAGRTDNVIDTIDYVRCYQLVRDIVENGQFHLLETIAHAIAEALTAEWPHVEAKIRVAKQPPLRGHFERFAVVIERGAMIKDS